MPLLALSLALFGYLPSPASAQRLRYADEWARVHPASYVATSVGVAGTLFFNQLYEPSAEANLTGPSFIDEPFQDVLRLDREEDREFAASLSDVLLTALLVWPVVDGLGVAGLGNLDSDLAWQLTMIHAEVVAADFVLGTLIKLLVHRERPHGEGCSREDRTRRPRRCGVDGRTRSFYSGHASAAFASAGVVCMTHAYVPLYDDPGGDAFACGAAVATASIIGLLRMAADRHYASDVFIGSIIGLATGLLLPYALHFGWDLSGTGSSPAPLTRAPSVMSFGGTF